MIFLYLDPGTGSLLINLVTGIIFAVIYFFKKNYYKLASFFSGNSKMERLDFSKGIVFFSEGRNYWKVYESVIIELIKANQAVIYLSADEGDFGLTLSSDFYESHFIGNMKAAVFRLNKMKAKMCVLTTPQLGVLSLIRSDSVTHYSHIIHSPTDIHSYKKFAFDYYDSILCSSMSQINNLRYLEQRRGSKIKSLFQTGCTYYDLLKSNLKSVGDSILVAPTWGDRTFFKLHGKKLLRVLLDNGYKVIFRPHPQSWISDKKFLNEVFIEFHSISNLVIDREISSEESFKNTRILISDITSGTLFDAAFLYKIPVIGFEFDWADGGYEASDLLTDTAARLLINDIGIILNVQNIEEISDNINSLFDREITQEIINKHIFNFRNSSKVAADQLMSIYNSLEHS
jgi:hypothetical protein